MRTGGVQSEPVISCIPQSQVSSDMRVAAPMMNGQASFMHGGPVYELGSGK